MVMVVIVSAIGMTLFLFYPCLKVAGDADRELEQLQRAFLLREEQRDGNSSKEVQQATEKKAVTRSKT